MSCNSYLEREIYRQYYIHHIKCTHVFLQTTREIFALKHHHLSLHITILFILDVANIFLITVIYEDINIDIISPGRHLSPPKIRYRHVGIYS